MNKLVYKGYSKTPRGFIYSYEYQSEIFEIVVESKQFTLDLPKSIIEHYGLSMALYLFNVEDFDIIEVNSLELSHDQEKFFEWYFLHGMAEFRYVNNINPKKQIKVRSVAPKNQNPVHKIDNPKQHYLIMIGGGKDSLVGYEVIKKIKIPYKFFGVNTNKPSLDILESIKSKDDLFDVTVIKQPDTKDGYKYNGHKPGSSFWAFGSVLAAYSSKSIRVVVSNEYSANLPQLFHQEFPINHQFSKSLEFEKRFNQYVNKYLVSNYTYFSILRPLYEIQIAKIFANNFLNKYKNTFISCNVSYSEGKWCKECAKCAFVYCIMSPFMNVSQIEEVWGNNLYESELICSHIYDLCSENISPLECVGTTHETKIALHLANNAGLLENAHTKYRDKLIEISKSITQEEVENIFDSYHDNIIPEDISNDVEQVIKYLLHRS